MKRNYIISLVTGLLLTSLLGACSQDELGDNFSQKKGNMVMVNADNGGLTAGTRAADKGEITPLPVGSRFALRMYYDDRSTNDNTVLNTMEEAKMKVVDINKRCNYTKSYDENNEMDATKFYWNNRKNHGFIGFYLQNEQADSTHYHPSLGVTDSLVFNMNFKEKDGVKYQDDPMLAVKSQQPTGGTNEANSVYLQFEHQTACVVVNVKPDEISVQPSAEDGSDGGETAVVTSISLLGTAKEISVHTTMDEEGVVLRNAEGEVATYNGHNVYTTASDDTIGVLRLYPLENVYKVEGKDITKVENDNVRPGYTASAKGLAFGYLRGIALSWDEHRTEFDNVIAHDIQLSFGDEESNYQKLESGKKYIYNVTLRRGTIATIRLEIVDWESDGLDDDDSHKSDGIISADQESK